MSRKSLLRLLIYCLLALASTTIGLAAFWIPFTHQLELRTYDYRFRARGDLPESSLPPITLVTIDEASLDRIPDPLMLWHKHFGNVLNGLVEGGATVAGVDFLFSDIEKLDPDSAQIMNGALLQSAIAGMPVVLAYRVKEHGIEQPPASMQMAASAVGHTFGFVNLTTDPDDFVRRQQLFATGDNGEQRPGFALAVADAYATKSGKPLPRPASDNILINFRQRGAFPRLSFADVLDAATKHDTGFLQQHFKGRIVLIAAGGGRGSEDLHSTPHYYWADPTEEGLRTAGIEIHANTIATLLAGNAIRDPGPKRQTILILTIAILVTATWAFLRTPKASLVTLSLIIAFGFFVVWMFGQGLWIWVVSPSIAGVCALGFTQSANYVFEGRERRKIHGLFGRYVSEDVITQLLDLPDGIVLTGERRRIAVMFADVRGFTTRSESSKPEQIVELLNEYFGDIVDVIQRHRGTVNSLMGDGIMAIFGAPILDTDAALHAVEAAREMMEAVRRFNERLQARHLDPIQIGIGINAGDAVIGNMGSPRMMEYTAIGDVVNTASRIEGKTKDVHADILIGQAVFDWLGGRILCVPRGEVQVKGRAAAVPVYSVPWAGEIRDGGEFREQLSPID